MYPMQKISPWFGVELDNPQLIHAQYKAMARQTPLLYILVITATFALAKINSDSAPMFLTLVVPVVLLVAEVLFFLWFMFLPKRLEGMERDHAIAVRLHATVWSSLILGPAYAVWAIKLFETGTPGTQGLTVAFIGVSVFGASLCLMHLKVSALSLIGSTMGVLVLYFWLNGTSGYVAAANNLALVALIFVIVLNWYAGDFTRMIKQQQLVEAKQKETEDLAQTNKAMANQDSLTGLANRRCFLGALRSHVSNVELGQLDGLSVGILDLDGFKSINDIYGHPMGDRLLKKVGERLQQMLCPEVLISRLGGDEFGIVVTGVFNDENLNRLGNKICDAMRAPFSLDGLVVHLGGSVGFSRWDNVKDTSETLFEKADYALYHAKENSRGGVTIFDDHHAATIKEVSGVDRRMRDADFDDEMSLVYQPIVDSLGGTLLGFEVLARWNSPILGFVSPEIFIRSAERAGMINRLTQVLLEKALAEAKKWPDHIFMSFNLSMQDISSGSAILKLVSIVEASGIDARRITFEVTETAVMNDHKRAYNSLQLLRNLGAKIALDDFGTGYSSLAYIRNLPLDKVKLDRCFVVDLEQDPSACAIAGTMIDMCQNLGVDCIIEGVETRAQAEILNGLGCRIIQGYYFSRPLNASDALAYALDNGCQRRIV